MSTLRSRHVDEALRVLPGLVAGRATVLDDGLEVTLAPRSTMPPVLVAGNGKKARLRAAAHGGGGNIHVGLDGASVANYAQWRSKEDFAAMLADPVAQEHMSVAASLAHVEPRLYSVVSTHER